MILTQDEDSKSFKENCRRVGVENGLPVSSWNTTFTEPAWKIEPRKDLKDLLTISTS